MVREYLDDAGGPDIDAVPGRVPGPTTHTLHLALHGRLRPHPWRTRSEVDSDAYSLFVSRSTAMGWLEHDAGGLWGMNDAAAEEGPDARFAWFQVSFTGAPPPGDPLPVQPFLACAADVVARLGVADVRAVQVLLPLAAPAGPALGALQQAAGVFADTDPRRHTPVLVTVDGGQDPAVTRAAEDIAERIDLAPAFTTTGRSDRDPAPAPTVPDVYWPGPSGHRVTVAGTLAEWSLDATGWLAAFAADVCVAQGVRTPVVLTVCRP